jgi:hypothetical protein
MAFVLQTVPLEQQNLQKNIKICQCKPMKLKKLSGGILFHQIGYGRLKGKAITKTQRLVNSQGSNHRNKLRNNYFLVTIIQLRRNE